MKTCVAIFALSISLFGQVQLTGTVQFSGQSQGTISTAPAPAFQITTSTLPSVNQNSSYPATTILTRNGAGTVTCANPSGMPPGLTINSNCSISGTASTVGSYTISPIATDSSSPTPKTATATFTIAVTCPPLQILSGATLPQATQSIAYGGFLMQVQGGIAPLTWSNPSGAFPTGMSISSGGSISGTPSAAGTFTPTAKVVDSCPTPQSAQQQESITVVANSGPLTLSNTTPLPACTVGSSCTIPLSATGGTAPYSFSAPGGWLPSGLAISGASITGTPSGAGISSGTLRVTDNVAATNDGSSPYSLTVNAASGADNRYVNSANQWIGPATDGPANAPTAGFNTARANTPSNGATVNVTSGSCASLQSAVSGASGGQVIAVPIADYGVCPLTASAAGDATHWITVRPSVTTNLPAEGTRLTPAWAGVASLTGRPSFAAQPSVPGVYVPKISSSTQSTPTIHFTSTAAYWRFQDFWVVSAAGKDFFQLVVADAGANHWILDQVWINGSDTDQLKNGIQAGVRIVSSPYVAVIDSTITNIGCINGNPICSGDSQGIFLGGSATGSDGPIKVVNNFIEAGGENIFSGGGGQGTSTVPASDVEMRRNHFFKPLWMKANDPTYGGLNFRVKNSLELKNAQRVWVEGNIFENVWAGQADQHGTAIAFNSRNQNAGYSGSASASGNTLTWVSGSQFQSNITSLTCAPGGCRVAFGGTQCVATSFISVTQITVSCSGSQPPQVSNAAFTAAVPGLNPSAVLTDVIFKNNIVRHAANGIQISNPPSDNGDLSLTNARFAIDNNAADDIDGTRWLSAPDCCNYGAALQIQNFECGSASLDQLYIWHNTFLPTYSSAQAGASFGFGSSASCQMTHATIANNISAGGWWTGTSGQGCGLTSGTSAQTNWNCWVATAQKCFDNNLLTTRTLPGGGTGTTTHDNPLYPQIVDNGGCSYGTALGPKSTTDYSTLLFTNLSSANGGNYQLQVGSPGHNAASDGADLGVNWPQLQNAIAGVQ